VRLALGTLTALPTPPPGHVDRRTGAHAMVLAPLVGLLLAGVVVGVLRLLSVTGLTPLLGATVAVALLAVLTRGIHLDGLADTADGLGSGKPANQALAVMRKGDVGPFGVATVVLVLLLQVAALDSLLGRGGLTALAVAVILSRLTLPLLCSRGVPAARPEGLGSTVAGTVSRRGALLATVLAVAALGVVALVRTAWAARAGDLTVAGAVLAVLLPLAAAGLLCLHCVRRLGGVTGDVLGACVEVAFTTCLVILSIA
jgi:adenosylcobinamide-GDP ribazoletransferase